VASGIDLLRAVAAAVPLQGIVGLSQRPACDAISGYHYFAPVAQELGVPFIAVDGYALSAAGDRARLEGLEIDVLLVCGWQRLVPEWLIRRARIGAVGAHGSAGGIAGGRGRSPQNWALILGADSFSVSIFFLDPGIDSGPVIATRTFPIEEADTIADTYRKVTLVCAEMLVESFRSGAIAARRATPQTADGYYLPQRLPEDGAIDWRRSDREVCRFVRALTRPYPGAFTEFGGGHLAVWRARPFSLGKAGLPSPGTIVQRFAAGPLLVAARNGLVLIEDWSMDDPALGAAIRPGVVLASVDFRAQMREIADRHRRRYPDLPLSPDILAACGGT
jgi:UDP-4-amino-4-deoxy-L-arabinose formyltransferase/UDP-glucuronic acid dehydrogenase (UDP-4-keto-hexauronic acid decarboxylating)